MIRFHHRPAARFVAALLMATSLSACGSIFDRLSQVGEAPRVSPVQNPADEMPHVTMPMPAPVPPTQGPNSLWRAGARAFLKDGRASQVGDIVTVIIDTSGTLEAVKDAVTISDSTTRTQTAKNDANTSALLGYESEIWKKLPGAQGTINPSSLLSYGSDVAETGGGSIARTDAITTTLAAVVTQVLPNGNLVIEGSQEIRVNFETRVLKIAGVIRQQDIRSDNTITHDKIAEARIIYGGRGQLTDLNQPRWGNQVLDVIFPF
jgi:flagellar L-ring protein precursor FlgH